MNTDHADLIQKLAMSLDTCLELVAEKSRREARNNEKPGRGLKEVTWRERSKHFTALVSEARDALTDEGRTVYF